MNIPQIRQTLKNQGRVYGTMVISPSPHWPKYLRKTGLDFVFIDTEHIALNIESVAWMCQAYSAAGIAPIVRIPSPDPYAASKMIDAGASGLLAPYIESAAEVQGLRGAVKFGPLKGSRLQDVLNRNEHLEDNLQAYLTGRNQDKLLLVNIESKQAIRNLDEILSVPGLDGIVVGPHDLSCSLGAPEEYESPDFSAALKEILRKTRERNLIAGIHFMSCGPAGLAIEWMRWGANFLIQHADVVYASRGLSDELQQIRRAFNDSTIDDRERINV